MEEIQKTIILLEYRFDSPVGKLLVGLKVMSSGFCNKYLLPRLLLIPADFGNGPTPDCSQLSLLWAILVCQETLLQQLYSASFPFPPSLPNSSRMNVFHSHLGMWHSKTPANPPSSFENSRLWLRKKMSLFYISRGKINNSCRLCLGRYPAVLPY